MSSYTYGALMSSPSGLSVGVLVAQAFRRLDLHTWNLWPAGLIGSNGSSFCLDVNHGTVFLSSHAKEWRFEDTALGGHEVFGLYQ